jgi:Holliday junction resolvase RusA-like endonuclease
MTVYTNHRKSSSAKRNSGRKPKLSERNRSTLKRIVSENHRPTAAKVTAELNIHLEDPVPTKKKSDEKFTNPTSTVQL